MSQQARVLEHLKSGKTITPLEALDLFGSFRLGALIFNLRKEGYHIQTINTHYNKKCFATYKLVEDLNENATV